MTNIELETLSSVKAAARKYISKEIDWEERRYEIAKTALLGQIIANDRFARVSPNEYPVVDSTEAVRYADALIAELKKKL